jgi:SAM-dependent methyltransferase
MTSNAHPSRSEPQRTPRSEAWHEVWDRRDPEKLSYDGYEDCVADDRELERLRTAQAEFACATLELNGNDHLLDIGCGTGALTSRLAPLARAVTAIDYSHDAVALARRRLKSFGDDVSVVQADIATFNLGSVLCTKALAIGSMHYLDGYSVLQGIVDALSRQRGIPVLVMDLPDAAFASSTKRDYDRTRWSHLAVDPAEIQMDFPGSTVYRGMFPWYMNDAVRFSILIPAARSRVP